MHIGRTEKKNLKINQILSKIPYVHIGMGLVALRKSFSSILVCNLASEDNQILFIGQNIFVFKEPFVGTLNLCLKDAWHRAKDENSIRPSWAEKTSKNW